MPDMLATVPGIDSRRLLAGLLNGLPISLLLWSMIALMFLRLH